MLALALDDPAFGILYVGVVAVLTAGLVFSFGMPRRWLQWLQLVAVLALGFFAGVAVTGTHTDDSGTAPVSVAHALDVAPASNNEHQAAPKAGPPDGQISVDIFQSDGTQSTRLSEQLAVKAGAIVHVEGWAFDASANLPCGAVDIAVDGKPIDRIRYGIPRADVGAAYKDAQHLPTGFAGSFSTKGLKAGDHQVRIRCIQLSTNTAFPGKQLHDLLVTK
jgi:hypothetical protein